MVCIILAFIAGLVVGGVAFWVMHMLFNASEINAYLWYFCALRLHQDEIREKILAEEQKRREQNADHDKD